MFRLLLSVVVCAALCCPSMARDPKEYDLDVNYDEARVPKYELPGEGKGVRTLFGSRSCLFPPRLPATEGRRCWATLRHRVGVSLV